MRILNYKYVANLKQTICSLLSKRKLMASVLIKLFCLLKVSVGLKHTEVK